MRVEPLPIVIELRAEDGKVLARAGETMGSSPTYLPEFARDRFHTIKYIDRYGDTIFNHLQMAPLISEMSQLRDEARTDSERRLIDKILEMARRCKEQPHTYLVFVGD